MRPGARLRGLCLAASLLCLSAPCAWAAKLRPRAETGLGWTGWNGAGGSVPWNIVVLLTLLTLLPALVLSMTPFVRLLVVFHFLRQALGTQSDAHQPDPDRAVADSHLLSDAAGGRGHSADRDCAV